jgi:hypothetical protein
MFKSNVRLVILLSTSEAQCLPNTVFSPLIGLMFLLMVFGYQGWFECQCQSSQYSRINQKEGRMRVGILKPMLLYIIHRPPRNIKKRREENITEKKKEHIEQEKK